MIDWEKMGPANSPTPSTPATTTPVMPVPTPPVGTGEYVTGQGWKPASQQQVDAMDIGERMGRGIDYLGYLLFGNKEGEDQYGHEAPLAGAQPVREVIGGLGDAAHAVATTTVVQPFEAGAGALARVPLSWLPGGADENFNRIGDWAKTNDPAVFQQWQLVNAAANNDVLYGGNLKADFNIEVAKYLDDQNYESRLGTTPELVMGREGVGSLGGALSHAIQGWLGVLGNQSQLVLGQMGAFDPGGNQAPYEEQKKSWEAQQRGEGYLDASRHSVGVGDEARKAFEDLAAGKITEQQARDIVETASKGGRSRIDEIGARYEAGLEVSDVEKHAWEAYTSGAWSKQHAAEWIVSHGQGITRNPIGQIAGSVVTDPLTYATLGAGAISKAGTVGARVAETVGQGATFADRLAAASSAYQKIGVAINEVQQDRLLGLAFRLSRGLIDPLATFKPSPVQRAVTDLRNGSALAAMGRAYGQFTLKDLRSLAREFDKMPEVATAMATYAIDQANLMIAIRHQKSALQEGLGLSLIRSNVDEVIEPLARNAPKDAITELTDHIASTAKNGFSDEDNVLLANRLASMFGKDTDYWTKRMTTMSDDLKSALHAVTYKHSEIDFEQAKSLVISGQYSGKVALDRLVLMSRDTLDDEIAQDIIENIRAVLKNEQEPERIAAATAEWNAQMARYPALQTIGYATGGKEQVEQLVKELEKQVEAGQITKRLGEVELADPELKPLRDWIDLHSTPTGIPLSPREMRAVAKARKADAEYAIRRAGFEEVSAAKFFPAIRKAAAVTKSNGRKVGETVYVYSKGEYANMRLFLSADKKTGFAIKPDGDLVSVFNVGDKGRIQQVIPHLNDIGATKLDAFDEAGRLPELYGKGGFKEVRREPWNPAYAPPNWTGGTPDVVYMEHPGAALPTSGSQPIWKIGFRPDEEVAWGLKQSDETGELMIDRAPTISHVVDAVPVRQQFSETTRNVLGQIIGKQAAGVVSRPIDSMEAMFRTQIDMVTGRRLVMNMERRFEKSMVAAGVPRPFARDIFAKARDVAGLDRTTIRGLNPTNLWDEIHTIIPKDLVLKDGSHVNIHTVMDHLLQASEGDLRIMGVTSYLSQRMRNALRKMGVDGANAAGQLTVTQYNKLRYTFNPMFIIQRITDAPYYSILYGVTPVGKGRLSEANAAMRAITDNLGLTGLARHFSMDMPEYATRSNFTQGIKSTMQQAGLKDHQLQRILDAPDDIIAANMTNMLHARLGNMVRGALDNLSAAASKDPELAAEMLQAGERLTNSFADWRRVYSEQVGRVLDDNEVGLMYLKDQLNAWRRHVVKEDGTLNFEQLIHEIDMYAPGDIGATTSFNPNMLAQKLGYADSTALRRDVVGHVEKINGEFILVKGEKDLPWLEEQLRTTLHAHPDKQKRIMAYYSETWDDFWHRLSRDVDKGGLDISQHYAKEAQDLIRGLAAERSMDPWEYLTTVMSHDLGPGELDTAMGRFVNFLKGGKAEAPGDWGTFFRSHLDPSAQQTLVDEWVRSRGGNVTMPPPPGFTKNPNVAASGQTFPPDIKREGLYHVTTAKDALMREGFKPSAAGAGQQGMGSLGDVLNQGRVSFVTDKARATAYLDRLTLAVKAARGETNPADILKAFEPVYERGWGTGARTEMENVLGMSIGDVYTAFPTPELQYKLVQQLDAGLIGGNLASADRIVKLTAKFDDVKNIDPKQIAMVDLATKERAQVQKGLDTAELTIKPEDVAPLGTGTVDTSKFFDKDVITMLEERVASGPHPNPDVEAAIQQIAKLTQKTLKGSGEANNTRTHLRELVEAIPTAQAAPYNRSQALIIDLLKAKIEDAQQDVFRLAEMQTKRTVLERSLNHPLLGLYPASYMWGKVLPETVKFLAKNPYAATYTIANVQRSIAIQREYDRELDDKISAVDRSAGAFLLDYLTPGLPWSDHQARTSPMVRGFMEGKDLGWIWDQELSTVSPHRWVSQVVQSLNEVPGALDEVTGGAKTPLPAWMSDVQNLPSGPAVTPQPGGEAEQITGPTRASALGPILRDDMTRLTEVLLGGASPDEE